MMTTHDLLFQALFTVVSLFLTVALAGAHSWLLRHISQDKLNQAIDIAGQAVAAVEQIYRKATGVDPQAKFAQALKFAEDLAAKHGLDLTPDQWHALIESAVHDVNRVFGPLSAATVIAPASDPAPAPTPAPDGK